MMQYFIWISKKKAGIICFGGIDQFDERFFVFVSYLEGKQIQNQPSIESLIKFQHLASAKSEPRNPRFIALMMRDLLEFQWKKAYIIILNFIFSKW